MVCGAVGLVRAADAPRLLVTNALVLTLADGDDGARLTARERPVLLRAIREAYARAGIVGGRPDRGRSCNPATPCSANRRRNRLTCTTV